MGFLKILYTVKIVDGQNVFGSEHTKMWMWPYKFKIRFLSRSDGMNELKRNEWLPQCSHATTSYLVRFIVAFKLPLLGDCLVTIFAEPPLIQSDMLRRTRFARHVVEERIRGAAEAGHPLQRRIFEAALESKIPIPDALAQPLLPRRYTFHV